LFDSNGTTLLGSVTATATAITSGGIAFRATGYDKYFDTVTATHGVNSFALEAGSGSDSSAGAAPVGSAPAGIPPSRGLFGNPPPVHDPVSAAQQDILLLGFAPATRSDFFAMPEPGSRQEADVSFPWGAPAPVANAALHDYFAAHAASSTQSDDPAEAASWSPELDLRQWTAEGRTERP